MNRIGNINKNIKIKLNDFNVNYGVCSNIGQRKQNQDAVLITPSFVHSHVTGRFFAIADGMGGHAAGAVASSFVCDHLNLCHKRLINSPAVFGQPDIKRYLTEWIIQIDRKMRYQSIKDTRLKDMGTTLSSMYITATHSIIAHVGDSRIYRFRKGWLTRLTNDHTFVQDMIFEGEVDPVQAQSHPLRHLLTNAVGAGEPLDFVDSRIDILKPGDCFLLCTDGLYNAVNENQILNFLQIEELDASDIAKALIKKAIKNNARDNITAIVVRLQVKKNR